MEFVFQNTHGTGTMISRVQKLRQFLRDILIELPASSVEVEKGHANLQQDIHVHCSNAKKEKTIQRDSYIMSAVLEHENLKNALEETYLGTTKGKVSKLLKIRSTETTALHIVTGKKRTGISDQGCVKGRSTSLLKGLLFLVEY